MPPNLRVKSFKYIGAN